MLTARYKQDKGLTMSKKQKRGREAANCHGIWQTSHKLESSKIITLSLSLLNLHRFSIKNEIIKFNA